MKQEKKRKGLIVPVTSVFFLLTAAIFVYGGIRYLMLADQKGALLSVLSETLPAFAVILFLWAFFLVYLSKGIVEPLRSMKRAVQGLSGNVSAGEELQKIEARGEIGELSDELKRQSFELKKLLGSACAETAKETERKLKLGIADNLYREIPSSLSLEGEGFCADFCLEKREGLDSDYLDVFLIDSHTVFLGIGDIWGRGIDAALFCNRLKSEMRAGVFSGKPLGRAVLDVNRSLFRSNLEGIGASAFFGIFSSKTGELRFVNMGHFPPVVTGMYAGFLHMSAGTPLGLFDDVTVGEESFVLSPGQTVVFATEGAICARDGGGNAFGEERYLGTVRAFTSNPRSAPEGLLKSVKNFCGELSDNAAALSLSYFVAPGGKGSSPALSEDLREDSESIYRALLSKAKRV